MIEVAIVDIAVVNSVHSSLPITTFYRNDNDGLYYDGFLSMTGEELEERYSTGKIYITFKKHLLLSYKKLTATYCLYEDNKWLRIKSTGVFCPFPLVITEKDLTVLHMGGNLGITN